MEWILIISLWVNAVLIYFCFSVNNECREYRRLLKEQFALMNEMEEVVNGYEKVICKERKQLQDILIGFLGRQEIQALKERVVWLEELKERYEREDREREEEEWE